VFGRITYELMASYLPTPQASQNDPAVAYGMNLVPAVLGKGRTMFESVQKRLRSSAHRSLSD
jgi:hypothetical protein